MTGFLRRRQVSDQNGSVPSELSERRATFAAFGATFAGDASSKLAVLLVSVLAARGLRPDEFAVYVGLLAVAVLCTGIWDAGVSTVLMRAASDDRLDPRAALRRGFRLRLATAPAWIVCAALGFTAVGSMGSVQAPAPALFAAASLLAGTSLLQLSVLRGRSQFGVAATATAIGRWSTAGGVALAALLADPANLLVLVAAAHVAGEALTLGIGWWATMRLPGGNAGRLLSGQEISLRAALPFAANSLLSVAYSRLDILLVAVLTTASQVALYAPASRIQDALYLAAGTMYVVVVPLFSRLVSRGEGPALIRARLYRICLLGGFLAGIGAILIFVLAELLIEVVLGAEYLGSALPTRIIIWSLPLSVIGATLLATLVAYDRGADTTRAFAAAFLVSLSLHLALDWWMGAAGAAIASLARDAANLIVAGYFTSRALRMAARAGDSAGQLPRQTSS